MKFQRNADGTLSSAAVNELELALAAITDQTGGLMDLILQKNFLPVFACSHSGLYFPADFVKGWGRDYGIGLGKDPVSEVWDTNYYVPLPKITAQTESLDQIMHPVDHCFAQVDFTMINPNQIGNWAIPAKDDPLGRKRAVIVRSKQLKNPKGRLHLLEAMKAEVQ